MKILTKPTYEHGSDGIKLSLTVDNASLYEVMRFLDSLRDYKTKEYSLKVESQKTIPSNRVRKMAWLYMEKIAHKLRMTKNECLAYMIERYSVMKRDKEGYPMIYKIKSTVPDSYIKQMFGTHAYVRERGENYKIVAILKTTTEMDNSEFAAFLDGIISECNELGIQV